MRLTDYLRLLGSLLRVLTASWWAAGSGALEGHPAGYGRTPLNPGGGVRPGGKLRPHPSC
jgi:hypothetical protein